MSVDLGELVPRVRNRVNPPGETFIGGEEDEWIDRLAGAFWSAKLKGFFTGYRVNVDGDAVENTDGGDDLSGELQQLIVLQAALEAIEMKFAAMPTTTRQVAPGPLENEVQRSAQVLKAILDGLRQELADLRTELVGSVTGRTSVYVVDGLLARSEILDSGLSAYYWAL